MIVRHAHDRESQISRAVRCRAAAILAALVGRHRERMKPEPFGVIDVLT
jgi:hypothetical protein